MKTPRYLPLVATAIAALTGSSLRSQCTLSIFGTGQPSTVLRLQVQANPGDFTLMLASDQAGSLTLPLGSITVNLGVLQPWVVIETGFADVAGFAVLNLTVPASLTQVNLHGQGFVLGAPFTGPPNVCTTNVVPFTIG